MDNLCRTTLELGVATAKELRRHSQHSKGADPHTRAGEIQDPVETRSQDPRRDHGRNNAKHAAPETRQTRGGAPDRGRKGLRRPRVQQGIEHALEEVHERVDGDVGRVVVHGGEGEEAGGEEGGGEREGKTPVRAPRVHQCPCQDAGDAQRVDVDVGAVGVGEGEAERLAFAGQDGGEERACDRKAPEVEAVDYPHEDDQACHGSRREELLEPC